MQLRVARHTEQLDEVVAFYRNGIGLTEIGGFRDHDGYDGVFLAVPGTGAHLELTAGGGHGVPEPHPESLLVLYLGDEETVQSVVARLGVEPIAPANPYWADHGLTFEDPDGFRVVLVPEQAPPPSAVPVRIEQHAGPRDSLRSLFELAEDSSAQLNAYIDSGQVLVAVSGDQILGHLQLTETDPPGEIEIKNMAVLAAHRGRGIGHALVAAAIELARKQSRSTVRVATAAADIDNLRFYQRLGFRMRSIERDAFTATTGYDPETRTDGIVLRDQVWLDLPVKPATPPAT
jgi:ribosomal protein S18 acetylase RimI-like enzyme